MSREFPSRHALATLATTVLVGLSGCSSDRLDVSSEKPDTNPRDLAAEACRTVDGAAHPELNDIAAQFEAQANDREEAATKAVEAATDDEEYEPLSRAIAELAQQSRADAENFVSDPEQLAADMMGGADAQVLAGLVESREECEQLGLSTE